MKELYYAPIVDFPTNSLGKNGRNIRKMLEPEELTEWEHAYKKYWKVLEDRIKDVSFPKGFHIYRHMVTVGKISKDVKIIKQEGAKGEYPDHIISNLLDQGGRLVPIESNYLTQKVLSASKRITEALDNFNQAKLNMLQGEVLELMPAVSAYRASVINRELKDGLVGILFEYGDLARTLNFLAGDIEINRLLSEEEYADLTEKIPPTRRR